jgi:predicted DNA-binding transcriptional regulator YafY
MEKLDVIRNAIDSLETLKFQYDGDNREVEPHLLGYNKTGALTLSAWQTYGRSGVGWRGFHVDKIMSPQSTEEKFEGPRAGYNPNDSTMDPIIHRI